jgi:hypothetical protein
LTRTSKVQKKVRFLSAALFKVVLILAGDVTTWKTLDLRTEDGSAVAQDHQKTILHVANQALEVGLRDPTEVLKAAKRVGRRAHLVANLRAYAARAIFAFGTNLIRNRRGTNLTKSNTQQNSLTIPRLRTLKTASSFTSSLKGFRS